MDLIIHICKSNKYVKTGMKIAKEYHLTNSAVITLQHNYSVTFKLHFVTNILFCSVEKCEQNVIYSTSE